MQINTEVKHCLYNYLQNIMFLCKKDISVSAGFKVYTCKIIQVQLSLRDKEIKTYLKILKQRKMQLTLKQIL